MLEEKAKSNNMDILNYLEYLENSITSNTNNIDKKMSTNRVINDVTYDVIIAKNNELEQKIRDIELTLQKLLTLQIERKKNEFSSKSEKLSAQNGNNDDVINDVTDRFNDQGIRNLPVEIGQTLQEYKLINSKFKIDNYRQVLIAILNGNHTRVQIEYFIGKIFHNINKRKNSNRPIEALTIGNRSPLMTYANKIGATNHYYLLKKFIK